LALKTDVSSATDCKSLIDQTIATFGKIDSLVLNAGIAAHQPFADTSLEVMDQLMQTNYWGYIYCTKFALPHLKKTRGQIVVVGSLSGELGLPLRTAYCATKFAVHGFFEALRTEIGNEIQITVVAPGFVKTNIRENALGPKEDLEHNEPDTKRMSAETCAKLIIIAAEKRKRKVILTFSGKLGVVLKPIMPRLVQYVSTRKANAKQLSKL